MNAPFSPMGAGADELLRLPPHNFEAEQALLGAILMSNRTLENLTEFLRSEHFADPLHGRIYDACTTLSARNQIASPVTLKHYFGEDPDLKEQGGDEYLVRLVGAVVSVRNAEDYGRLVYELAQRRAMIGMGEDLVNDAFDTSSGTATAEVLERHEAALTRLNSQSGETKVSSFSEAVDGAICEAEAVFKADGKLRGLTTGLTDLDRKMGGLHPTDLIILAGRPSMGKSALAHNIAENAARSLERKGVKKSVLFISLEMSKEQLAVRSLSRSTGISGHKIRNGPLSQADMQSISEASVDLRTLPLKIDDTPALSVFAIRNRARRVARNEGLALIVIDYLQLIGQTPDRSRRGPENRTQEVSEITRQLKALSKELDVPVLALSQLSRKVEEREDKRPQLADLRESGSIEQDADVVMFVYREQYYLERSEPEAGGDKYTRWAAKMEKCLNTGDAIIAKQRHGPIGTVRLHFNGDTTTFSDLQHSAPLGDPWNDR